MEPRLLLSFGCLKLGWMLNKSRCCNFWENHSHRFYANPPERSHNSQKMCCLRLVLGDRREWFICALNSIFNVITMKWVWLWIRCCLSLSAGVWALMALFGTKQTFWCSTFYLSEKIIIFFSHASVFPLRNHPFEGFQRFSSCKNNI